MDLSLDDIIAQRKKSGGGGRRGGGGGARRGGGGGGGVRRNGGGGGGRVPGGAMFTKSVPGGRWKHDKFNEIYGGVINGGGSGRRSGGGGPTNGLSARFSRSGGGGARGRGGAGGSGDIVKLNISNLAETVVTADLEELFEAYKVLGVTVHYDEAGNHLGTADVFLTRRTAEQIIADFTGVAIDGREMKIFVVDENNVGTIPTRISVAERLARTQSNPLRKRTARRSGGPGSLRGGGRRRGGGGGGLGGGARGRAPVGGGGGGGLKVTKLSAEELDRELDSYMGSGKHKRISID